MAPEFFQHISDSLPRRWDRELALVLGRPKHLKDAEMTVLSDFDRPAAQLATLRPQILHFDSSGLQAVDVLKCQALSEQSCTESA
eukprot:1286924-Amphidinium_carterae.1